MSIDVNEIMEMLDWKNQEDIQARGRILAANIRCLKIFMQPMDKQYNKNIWGNCARVLRGKTDTELSPYLFDLLNWIKDMN